LKKYLIATLVALGLMFGGPDWASAYHDDFAHPTLMCRTDVPILYVYNTLRTRDVQMTELMSFQCRPIQAIVTSADAGRMQPLAAPAKDFGGDWYAPYKYTRTSGKIVYFIVYFAKGKDHLTTVDIPKSSDTPRAPWTGAPEREV